MLFISIPGFTRWFRGSLPFQPSSDEVAFFQAEIVHDSPPDRPYPTGAEILLDHLDQIDFVGYFVFMPEKDQRPPLSRSNIVLSHIVAGSQCACLPTICHILLEE